MNPCLTWSPTAAQAFDPPYGLCVGTQIEIDTLDGLKRFVVTEVDAEAGTAYLTEVEDPPHPGHCGCMGGTET